MKVTSIGLLLLLFSVVACKKNKKNQIQNTSDAPAFHSGKGIRPLKIVTAGYFGGVQNTFLTADVSLSDDGILHWCYGLTSSVGENELHRMSLNLSTTDTVLETGKLVGISAAALNPGDIKYVPYTNNLYSLVSNAAGHYIDGDVHFNFGSEILDLFHPYASGTLSSAGLSSYTPNGNYAIAQANAYILLPGASTQINQIYNHQVLDAPTFEHSRYRLGAFGLDQNNNMIALLISGDSAVAIDMSTGTTLASIPYSGMQTQQVRFSSLANNVRSVTSSDRTRMAAMFKEQLLASAAPTITTLTYNFLTKELKVGVPGVVPAHLTVDFSYSLLDIVEDGSIVYGSFENKSNRTGLRIMKQKGLEETVLASGFLDDNKGILQFLHASAGKIFVGINTGGSTPGETKNSTAQVLGVVE